jgi:energy-converting hydrogenase Eha subunit E
MIQKNRINEVLQWTGALFIIVGHMLNAVGSEYHKDIWNQLSFAIGTVCFLIWTLRVANKPQMTVNIIGLIAINFGIFKAIA